MAERLCKLASNLGLAYYLGSRASEAVLSLQAMDKSCSRLEVTLTECMNDEGYQLVVRGWV